MELNDLYCLATQNGIEVHSIKCPNSTAISLNIDGCAFVGIDRAVFKNETREKQVLAHELAHALTNAYYDDLESEINIRRMEYRATKKEIEFLIPKDKLEKMLCEDITVWELSENFDVSPNLIKKALWIYFNKEMV